MANFEIGTIIVATPLATAGTGQYITQCTWTLDGINLLTTGVVEPININTNGMSAGLHTLGLLVQNDCGSLSSVYNNTFTLVAPYICPIPTASFTLA